MQLCVGGDHAFAHAAAAAGAAASDCSGGQRNSRPSDHPGLWCSRRGLVVCRDRIVALRSVRPGGMVCESPGSPLKLLLINNHSLLNAGDYAILAETLRMLEARFPAAQID